MKIRIVLLFLAIIFGIAAVFGVMFYVNNVRASVDYASEKINTMVAVKDIQKDIAVEKLISDKMVVLQPIPRQFLVTGALASLDQVKGYITATNINPGEQITANKFIKPSEMNLSFTVPEGMLAISIPIDEIIGVSNLINIGDKVNVIATFQPDKGQTQDNGTQTTSGYVASQDAVKQNVTKTLLWNIQVLHIGNKATDDNSKNGGLLNGGNNNKDPNEVIKTYTLAVTPEQSEKLVFSEELGTVWLALVPLKGLQEKETSGRTFENVFNN